MILAILSRETGILFPLLLTIYLAAFNVGERILKNIWLTVKSTWPFYLISLLYFLLRLTVLNFKNTLNFYAQANDYTQHLSYRLYTFCYALMEYFKLIIFPRNLHMERDLALKTSLWQWPVGLAAVVIVVWVAGLVWFYRRQRGAGVRNSNFRVLFFFTAFFFVAMAPVSGVLPINAIIYEHWLYLPLVAISLLFAYYVDKLLVFLEARSSWRQTVIIGLVVYFGYFAVVSMKRNIMWGDAETFYLDIIKYNPDTVRILNNLGNLYSEKRELGKAAEFYQRAIANPNGGIFAQPYYNLGNIFRDTGKPEEAIKQYHKAIAVDPNFTFAYQNLAVVYVNQGKFNEAAEVLEKLKIIKPGEPRLYYNLSLVYLALKKNTLAIENLRLTQQYSVFDPEAGKAAEALLKEIEK